MPSKQSKKTKASKKAAPEQPLPMRRQCGAMQAHMRLLEEDPNFRSRQFSIEQAARQRLATPGSFALKAGPTKIPVVVHVVFNTKEQNISISQIKSQIKVLNRDFRAKNTDKSKVPAVWKGLVADANIQFVLATKDPSGKSTNGVTRT